MAIVSEHKETLGVAPACVALAVPRSSYYRSRRPKAVRKRRGSPRALSATQRREVLSVMHDERFTDLPPAEVYATLLDEGTFLCSISTMYRLLRDKGEVRERRDQLVHPRYGAPELLAGRPKELWSWDITKLKGPRTWTYYYLYVILDVFSRYVVGWMAAYRESAALAAHLIEETCRRQGIARGQLTVHADRGPSMISKTVAMLLCDLGVTKTHSRPHVSNDNPFSESQFKTLKYRPQFPDRFGSLEDARSFCGEFFPWYNMEHHHGGLGFMTPHDVHTGLAKMRYAQRETVLQRAFEISPERFVRGLPKPPALPQEVWINKPKEQGKSTEELVTKLEEEVSHFH